MSINQRIREKQTERVDSKQPLVFVMPVYAWRIPKIVRQWMEKTEFTGNRKAYFITTCGDSNGDASKYVRRLCERKSLEYMGCAQIVMPENYIVMFSAPSEAEARRILADARLFLEETAEKILKGEPLPEKKISWKDRLCSGLIHDLFYLFMVHPGKFRATDRCTGCGKCEKHCPLRNISMKEAEGRHDLQKKEGSQDGRRPQWGRSCTHCMACICGCPEEAIEYGTKTRGKIRYQCPL